MACSKPAPVLSFAEIVQGRDSSVRITDDGLADVVDLVMTVTAKNCNDSNEALRNLKASLFDKEKILTRNQRRYVTLRDAITLVMVLPGKMAKEIRSQFAAIIEKHIQVIENPNTGIPTVQLVNELEDHETRRKRARREDLELLKLEEEVKTMAQTRMTNLREEYKLVCADTQMDERARLLFKDTYMNILMNSQAPLATGQQATITNGPSPNSPISISSVAAELGYKLTPDDSKRIGVDLKKRYVKLHDKPPPKHQQLCGGLVMNVNSYTEQDRPLMVETLDAYFKGDDSDNE